ncbi:MAG: hypothetical protein QM736_17785 [Vicinamibacterales bacterium]
MPDLEITEGRSALSAQGRACIESGALDFGVVLADDAYRSYFGDSPTGQKPNSMVRAI